MSCIEYRRLRRRYVGGGPVTRKNRKLLERFSGVHVYDSTGGGYLPNVRLNATWTEIGLPWIDQALLNSSKTKNLKLFTWFEFNFEFGGFAPEIDHFLQSRGLAHRGDWQIVLLRSGSLKAVCTRYTNTDEFFGDTPERRRLDAWLICLDHDFIYDVLSMFAAFPLGFRSGISTNLGHLLRLMIHWPKGKYPNNGMPEEVVPAYLRSLIAESSPEAAALIDQYLSCTDVEREDLEMFSHVHRTKEFASLWKCLNENDSEYEAHRGYLLKISKSMIFHFLVGHELGHYLSANRSNMSEAKEIYGWVDSTVLNNRPKPERSVDECCSDVYGIINCMHQASRFEVPVELAVSAINWVWLFAATNADPSKSNDKEYWNLLKNRHYAMFCALSHWRLPDGRNAADFSEDLFHIFQSTTETMRKKLSILKDINSVLLEGKDMPRRLVLSIY